MNTTEFSELLRSLLEEVHVRAVEQYSRAASVRDGTVSVAVRTPTVFNGHLGMSQHNALPNPPQILSKEERPMFKHSSSGFVLEQKHGSSSCLLCTPFAEGMQPNLERNSTTEFFLERPSCTPFADSEDIGRCFTVPDVARAAKSPRASLLSLGTGKTFHDKMSGKYGDCVINPERTFMQYWDAITIVAMAFVAVVSPVQVAFLETQMDAMFMVNCIVDCVFIADLILQFFLMYHVRTGFGNRLEHRRSRIAVHYLKTWFLVDFISILPFDFVAFVLSSEDLVKAKGVKFIRILRMLKMMRMLKASRIFKRLESTLLITNTYQVLDLHKFVLYLLLLSHWLACLWAMTLSLVEEDAVRWVDTFEDAEFGVEDKTKDSVWKLYVASLYFTTYTMTSVGYGDVTPVNILERIVCILILFISGLVWACVIGQVTSIVSNLDAHEQEFRRLMDNLNRMMRDRQLPRPVRKRLKTFFLSARQAQRHEQQEQILRRMSPVLQGEVALMSNWKWVKQVGFIYKLMPEVGSQSHSGSSDVNRAPHFVVDIALALGSVIFAQSEVFGERRVLYILRKGLVLSRAGRGMRVFCTGDVWGEDFVLSKSSLRESEVRLAATYVEIFQLTIAGFIRVCQKHSANILLRRRLRQFVVRLSARQAILVEARWRRFAAAAEAQTMANGEQSTRVSL